MQTNPDDIRPPQARPGLAFADTRHCGDERERGPDVVCGLADTRAPATEPEPLDSVDSRTWGVVGRPEFDDPDEQRRRQAIRARLFGDAVSPVKIGRYKVLERLGSGGMGVVYAAYDDRLDRKVALKVLRPEATGSVSRIRLQREAQAMARLSHANIVSIHEVGEEGDEVFVAMEFVRGQSLDYWLEQRRPWREVIEVFLQAGRGLQAAHDVGLVHRDFKPANAILGADGRVKVLDFGLARAAVNAAADDAAAAAEGSLVELRLTHTGAMLGTPMYMSPEQLSGAEATPASDQFAFFVALHEALYGVQPFAGTTLPELMASVLVGRLPEPPAGTDVPAWIRQAVCRGLATDPAARFADMNAALAALSRDPARARRRLAAVAGLMLVSAGASAGLMAVAADVDDDRCHDREAASARVWNAERAAAARAAFVSVAGGFGARTWERVEPRLATWVGEWTHLRHDRCQAYAAGRLSDTLHDLSVACLERRLARVDGLVGAFIVADLTSVEQAPAAVAALPSLAACTDANFLTAEVRPPDEPRARAAAASGREALEQARASIDLGQYEAALARSREVASLAGELNYPPLLAEAEVVRGDALHWRREAAAVDEALSAALALGLAHGDDVVAAEALARRIFVRAELAGDPQRALADVAVGRALLQRVDADARLSWLLENNIGVATERLGRYDEAARGYEEALRSARAIADGAAIESVYTQYNLGLVDLRRHELGRAGELLAGAVASAEHLLGPEHPLLVSLLEGEATAAYSMGRHAHARAVLARARAIFGHLPQPNPALVVQVAVLEARIAVERRESAAGSLAERAEALARSVFGADDPRVAATTVRTQFHRPEHEEALTTATEALAELGTDLWADALLDRMHALVRAGQSTRALTHLQHARARATWIDVPVSARAALGLIEAEALLELGQARAAVGVLDALEATGDDATASPLTQRLVSLYRGRAAELTGDPQAAVTHLRRAVDGYAASFDEDHPEYALARFLLARALRAIGQAQEAGVLADQARSAYQSLGPGFAREAAEVDAWLAGG